MSTVPGSFDLLTEAPFSAFPHVPFRAANNPAQSLTLYPETAVLGLGQRQVLPQTRITIQSWFARGLNDFYAIYIQPPNAQTLGQPAASNIVSAIANSYDLNIPGTTLPDGEYSIFSRVVRAGSQQESRSDPQIILIKTSLPGGIDRQLGDTWLSGLTMRVEGLPENSVIDANVAASGMTCLIDKYENIRKNDRIAVSVGGVFVNYIVSPTDAAGPGPIRIPVPPPTFSAANNFSQSGPVEVSFKVIDVVENVSGGIGAKYQFSRPYILNSELDPNLIEYPEFQANGIAAPVVDLETQSQAVFTIQAILPRRTPAPTVPDLVVGILTITNPDGTIRTVRLPAVSASTTTQRIVSIPVSNAQIMSLADSSFRVSFERQTSAGVFLARSGSYPVRVVGAQPLVRDFTAFNDYSFNGWVPGPNVDSRDLRYIVQEGVLGLFNNTFTNNSAGTVLKKTFTNLQIGARYAFSAQVGRWIGQHDFPIVSLTTSQGPITPPVTITTMFPGFVTLRGEFTANTRAVDCMFVSNLASGVGNDYRMANFEVVRL
jgi:hypothetical protein